MNETPCRHAPGPLLRHPSDLDIPDLASEEVRHLKMARVVLAEYDVLQHDFPELRTESLVSLNPHLETLSEAERRDAEERIIDDWILDNAAFISKAQAAQTIFNTPIEIDERSGTAYRPPLYGRSLVMPTQTQAGIGKDGQRRWPVCAGLLDLKGAGLPPSDAPAVGGDRNGLEYLGLALTDFFIKKAIDCVFARALPTVWTVPVYAVLDLGFDIVQGFHGPAPAGMHVRRAHRRLVQPPIPPCQETVTLEIESVFRRYGLTAAARDLQLHISVENGGVVWRRGSEAPRAIKVVERIGASLAILGGLNSLTVDRRDVQLAREVNWPPAEAQMVDFGAIRVENGFDVPMIRSQSQTTVHEVIWPHDAGFVQPDPALKFPVAQWNRYRLKALCFEMVEAFRRGHLSSRDIRRTIDSHILEMETKWKGATL